MKILQATKFMGILSMDNSANSNLNEFVKKNLKGVLKFNLKPENEKKDILNTYWVYLDEIVRQIDRVNGFIIYALIPLIENYKNKFGFKFFSIKNISENVIK